jgi:hypothetical protein
VKVTPAASSVTAVLSKASRGVELKKGRGIGKCPTLSNPLTMQLK